MRVAMSVFDVASPRMTFDLLSSGTLGALMVGITGSVHCAVMCGPLACVGLQGSATRAQKSATAAAWHGGRVISYTAFGALLGSLGGLATGWTREAHKVLPWVMVAGLLLSAVDLTRLLPASNPLSRFAGVLMRRASTFSPVQRGLIFGAMTPLLPCGLLYGMFLAAAATGSAFGGALLAGVFALGAMPALAAVQLQATLFKWPAGVSRFLRVAVPLVAAGVVAYRAWQGEAHCCH